MSSVVVLERLLFVALLGGVIGFERERHGRAAGLRTHILVGMGSCLMMLTGIFMAETWSGSEMDPSRIAAQVVSGIGFLGAGTILRSRASIRGLTTAASLWVVAGVGLAVGAGFEFGAAAVTLIALVVLFSLGRFEWNIRRDWYKLLVVETASSSLEVMADISRLLALHDVEVRGVELKRAEGAGITAVELDVKLLSEQTQQQVTEQLARIPTVQRVSWR
ncbi:MAG: MgtC/SapB family protein [Candidatus Omnitrophica bacterium]|nr:MgtC/SapB family protein [Candidatus Omnitrophota bacterium]